jgi:hypothetical protein
MPGPVSLPTAATGRGKDGRGGRRDEGPLHPDKPRQPLGRLASASGMMSEAGLWAAELPVDLDRKTQLLRTDRRVRSSAAARGVGPQIV